jgi:hypothetical protein
MVAQPDRHHVLARIAVGGQSSSRFKYHREKLMLSLFSHKKQCFVAPNL